MTNKNELKNEQLNKVSGGIVKHNPKGNSEDKCSPRTFPIPLMVDGKPIKGQSVMCSDLTQKGLKSECDGCAANK